MRLLHLLVSILLILPIFVRDAPIAIVLEFQLKIFSVLLTSKIVVAPIQLLLQLIQVGLPIEHNWLHLHTGRLGMPALLNQLLKLFNVRVFHDLIYG